MKKSTKRIISILLCFAIILPNVPSIPLGHIFSRIINKVDAAVTFSVALKPNDTDTDWCTVDEKNKTITILKNPGSALSFDSIITGSGSYQNPANTTDPTDLIDFDESQTTTKWTITDNTFINLDGTGEGTSATFPFKSDYLFGKATITVTVTHTPTRKTSSVAWTVLFPMALTGASAPRSWDNAFTSDGRLEVGQIRKFTDFFQFTDPAFNSFHLLKWSSSNTNIVECASTSDPNKASELVLKGGGIVDIYAEHVTDKLSTVTATILVPIKIHDANDPTKRLIRYATNVNGVNVVEPLHALNDTTLGNPSDPDDDTYEINVRQPRKDLYWYSSNTNVATVSSYDSKKGTYGGDVTPLYAGTSIITAQLLPGENSLGSDATASYDVFVPLQLYTNPSTGSGNYIGSAYGMTVNETLALKTNVSPKSNMKPTLISDNPDVVSVSLSSTGAATLVARKNGTATIMCTYDDPNFTNTTLTLKCIITVGNYLYLNKDNIKINEGATTDIQAITSATEGDFEWSTSNEQLATIESVPGNPKKAVLTAISAGEISKNNPTGKVTITLKHTLNGVVKTATCTVEITVPIIDVTIGGVPVGTVEVGQTVGLSAIFTPEQPTNTNVVWSSSDPTIATVASNGKVCSVKPLKAGIVSIILATKDGTILASCTIIISEPIKQIVLPDKYKNVTLEMDMAIQLYPTVVPANATKPTYKYISSNENVATVEQTGVVTAVSPGKAIITILSADGGDYEPAYCNITVGIPVQKVTLSPTSKTLSKGKTARLYFTIHPYDATDQKVTWTSSNTKVAKVNSTGLVTAVGGGKCKITVRTNDQDYRASSTITVKELVSKITLNKTSVKLTKKSTSQLKATVLNSTASNKKVTWKSSNPKIATVSSSGKITAKAIGKTVITCTAADGSKKYTTCTVNVIVPASRIILNKTSINVLTGKKYTLVARTIPANASIKTFKWTSSNPDIVSVNSFGTLNVLAPGNVVITCTTTDGTNKKAICYVYASSPIPASGVKLNLSSITLVKGGSTQLEVSLIPHNSNDTYKFFTENKSVATVNKNGLITAVGPGTTNVSVVTFDAGATASVAVNVMGLSNSQITIHEYEKLKITVDGATVPVYWSSSNNQIATVTNGEIQGKKHGVCYIYAKVGQYTLSCKVTVKCENPQNCY